MRNTCRAVKIMAKRENRSIIYYNLVTDKWGACDENAVIGHYDENEKFHKDAAVYFPATTSIKEMENTIGMIND